jgi:hypothetical protein
VTLEGKSAIVTAAGGQALGVAMDVADEVRHMLIC